MAKNSAIIWYNKANTGNYCKENNIAFLYPKRAIKTDTRKETIAILKSLQGSIHAADCLFTPKLSCTCKIAMQNCLAKWQKQNN